MKYLLKAILQSPLFYHQWNNYNPICVVLSLKDHDKYSLVREIVLEELPKSRILSFQIGHPEEVPRKLVDNDRNWFFHGRNY